MHFCNILTVFYASFNHTWSTYAVIKLLSTAGIDILDVFLIIVSVVCVLFL